MKWADPIFYNYARMFQDKMFLTSVGNTFLYLLIQIPILLVLAIQRRLIPSYIFLTFFSLLSVFPLFWMFTAATNTTQEVAQGKIFFGTHGTPTCGPVLS